MRTVLPGKPQAKLQALCATLWEGQRFVTYISGNALVILSSPHNLIQTIYNDELLRLEAVVIDEATGKIAVCSSKEVHIYKPYGKKEGALKWSFQTSLQVPNHGNGTLTLSWGSGEELLIGSSSLRLYETAENDTLIWTRSLPKPVKLASFSYDASLIASTSHHDRLIKIWRRQSSGSDDTRFDFTYLPHPTAVTDIFWRKPHDRQQILDHVLFSTCADSKIRVWTATDPHGLQTLQLWAEIDMQEALQPRHIDISDPASDRYAFFIDSEDFRFATERASPIASNDRERELHALGHLLEVAKTSPDICVVVDRRGNMSAWGLENVGCHPRKDTDIYNIAHVENVNISFSQDAKPEQDNVKFLTFCSQRDDLLFTLLVHHFDGRIMWYDSKLEELFDPSPRQSRLRTKALWTGHDGSVKKIVRSGSGKSLISRTSDNEGLIWRQRNDNSAMALTRLSSLSCTEHIHRSCLLEEGDFVVNLHHHSISLWDARSPVARLAVSCTFQAKGKPLCLIPLPYSETESLSHYVATITSVMEAIVWKVELPATSQHLSDEVSTPTMSPFCTSELGTQDDLVFVLPVDPAGSFSSSTSHFLDTFAKELAISYTNSGVLRAWTAKLDLVKCSFEWLVTSTTETGINNPSLASGSSIRKIAVVDSAKTGLTIWDPLSGQLEFNATYESSDSIQDLDWSSTPDEQSILAVGFPYKVMIMAQMRYDYLNAGPAWVGIREIHIKELTLYPIGDSTWLGSGNLVVGAGNQLYVYDKALDTTDNKIMDLSIPVHHHQSLSIFDIVTYLNGPLPVFHPQFLAQCILAGKTVQVQQIIIGLYKALRFFVDGEDIDSFVAMRPSDFYVEQEDFSYAAKKQVRSSYADSIDDDEPETVTEELANLLNENLAKLAIPQLSSHDQFYLASIVECVATAEKQRRSMDENAMRYLLFFRQHMIRKSKTPATDVSISWREMVWAYHSGSQDILVDLVSRQFNGRMLWEHARESGMFMWMTDLTALRAQFEVIARNEYTKTDEKNPIDCSLYYLALKKKSVLVGLWRMAGWNREQSGTQKLLSNDFSEARWKTAALKNAYALLGKRRFEYAAAFFLLAGNLQDAINVCTNQLHDVQLAVAIARVYDGDDSLVLRSLLEDKVLIQAAFEDNRWLATWAFWMLGRRDMAVRVLISPVYTLIDTPDTPNLKSKSYLSTDPALVILYKQLRGKTLQALKGVSKVSPRAEWDFVVQSARLYDRMGCDLLALDLVRNWEFLRQPKETNVNGAHSPDPRKMLRRRSSLVVDDMPSPRSPAEQKIKPFGKPAPTVFEEPSTTSLLDSFGF